MNGWITASGSSDRVGVDPRARGVDDRHAREHVRLVDPVAERAGGGGELDSRVHTLRLHRVSSLVHCNAMTFVDEQRNRVCQVELALRVVRRESVEHRPQPICPEDVDGRVHLTDAPLLVCRISILDDRLQSSVRVSQDAAVVLRIVGLEREHGRGDVLSTMRLDELAEHVGGQERRVAGEDEHVVGRAVEGLAGAANGVSCSARLAPAPRPACRRTRRPSWARRRPPAARRRAHAPTRAPSPPSDGRVSDADASARPSACACRDPPP